VSDERPGNCAGDCRFQIPCQSATATEPCESTFDHPALREDDKSFCVIGTLDDLHIHPTPLFCHGAAKQRALIAAIGVEFHQERKHAEHGRHDECAARRDPEHGGRSFGITVRLSPPRLPGGINASFHSSSLRSLGYRNGHDEPPSFATNESEQN
jgi:hypothetical protein